MQETVVLLQKHLGATPSYGLEVSLHLWPHKSATVMHSESDDPRFNHLNATRMG